MTTVANQLRKMVDDAKPRLLALGEEQVAEKPYADKWSLKEVLGHLIDSAANNHQRFVRMQLQPDIGKFSYEQERWNAVQNYASERWNTLVDLWSSYNTHLAHVIEHVNPDTLDNVCDMDYSTPRKLRFVMEDYLRHVEHHLEQIFNEGDPRERRKWVRREQ